MSHSFRPEKLLHVPHVAGDATTRRALERFYLDVFGAQTFFEASPVEGLERAESLILIGELGLIPVSSTVAHPADDELLSRFVGRFAQIAIKVPDIASTVESMRAHGVEPIFLHPRHADLFFLTDLKQTLNVRFEFCAVDLPNDLRLRPEWSSSWWSDHHPLGIERLSSIVTATADVARASDFYQDVFGFRSLGSRSIPHVRARSEAFLGGDKAPFVIEVWGPLEDGTPLADFVSTTGGGIFGITFKIRSFTAALGHLRSKGLGVELAEGPRLVIDPNDAFGVTLMMVDHDGYEAELEGGGAKEPSVQAHFSLFSCG